MPKDQASKQEHTQTMGGSRLIYSASQNHSLDSSFEHIQATTTSMYCNIVVSLLHLHVVGHQIQGHDWRVWQYDRFYDGVDQLPA